MHAAAPPIRRRTPARAKLLTAAEEVELARTIRAGRDAAERQSNGTAQPDDATLVARGADAKRRFVEANIGLVVHLANKLPIPHHVDLQDVIHDGVLGLERALEDFDPDRGWRFSTYASWWVRRTMQQGLETTTASVRIPGHRLASARRLVASSDSTPESSLDVMAAQILRADSLDAPLRPGMESDHSAALAARDPGPADQVLSAQEHRIAHELLSQLDPENAALVVARYGLDGSDGQTLNELADQRGVTPEAVRRRILRSLAKLRPHAERLIAA